MSDGTKKRAEEVEWTDCLGTSELPDDDMTFTDGSNYGLDGFQFDSPEDAGVLDGARLPEVSGLSGLPDGFVQAAVPGLDLNELTDDPDNGIVLDDMLSHEEGGPLLTEDQMKEASLADLDWRDPTQPQDPARLPKNLVPSEPPLNSVPELEEAWGANRRTDGIHLLPNKDLEAVRYEESIKEQQREGPHTDLPGNKMSSEVVKGAFLRAVRLAHYGTPIADIKRDLVAQLGHEAKRLRKHVAMLEGEVGLLGKVFVRASAFPGLKNGKWAKELKRVARTARYVVTDDEAVASKLSKEMVAEVPWGEALAHYAPRLKAAGFKVASSGDPKKVLQRSLLAGPQVEAPAPTVKPEGVVMAKTPEVVDDGKPIQSSEKQAAQRKMRAALSRVAGWVKNEKLSREDALRLHGHTKTGTVTPEGLLKAATDLMTASGEVPVYEGTGNQVSEAAQLAREKVWASLDEQQAKLEAGQLLRAKDELNAAVKAGQLTQKEALKVMELAPTAGKLRALTAAAIQAAGEKRQPELEVVLAADYEGTPQEAAPLRFASVAPLDSEMQRVMKAASDGGVKAGEILGMLRWARMQMSEGLAGKELDVLLAARFSRPLIKAAAELVTEARQAHEGLAGRLYVDAAAYASTSGTTGCEKGAMKHRANALKYVLSMERCATCTANVGGACQKYNKKLAEEAPVDNAKDFQKEALRLADAPDADQTAALFDTSEYQLNTDPLTTIELDPDLPAQTLSDVLFGGIEL